VQAIGGGAFLKERHLSAETLHGGHKSVSRKLQPKGTGRQKGRATSFSGWTRITAYEKL